MAIFPASLPQPMRDGYSATPGRERRRFMMDDGQSMLQRRWASQPFSYQLKWQLSWDQLKYIEAWFEYEVLQGDGWFTISVAGRTIRCAPIEELQRELSMGRWAVSLKVESLTAAPNMPAKAGLPQWPSVLPTLEQDGYAYSTSGSWTVPEIQDGLIESRNRFRNKAVSFVGSIKVTTAQRDAFWNFYRDELADGIAWFAAPFENGMGRTMARSKFGADMPNETPQGSMYNLALSLETAAAPMLSKSQFYNA